MSKKMNININDVRTAIKLRDLGNSDLFCWIHHEFCNRDEVISESPKAFWTHAAIEKMDDFIRTFAE